MSTAAASRLRHLDDIAEALPQRAARLGRVFLARTTLNISRTEAGVLGALARRGQRITDLAAAEGVTQPAITLLVNRLQERGWMTRRPDPADRRAVLVELTSHGRQVYEQMRAEYRALLHVEMATLSDEEVEALARATEVLDALIERLQERQP